MKSAFMLKTNKSCQNCALNDGTYNQRQLAYYTHTQTSTCTGIKAWDIQPAFYLLYIVQ